MIYVIAIVGFLVWLRSYMKFCRRYSYFKTMVHYLKTKAGAGSGIEQYEAKLSLSAALIEIQHYADAYGVLEEATKEPFAIVDMDKIERNMDFCRRPVPGVGRLKNFHHSYWHNFVLVRLGRRRFNILRESDLLATDSILRNMK